MTTRTLARSVRQPACHSRADSAVSNSRLKPPWHSQLHVRRGRGRADGHDDPSRR
jgi:hypothetical protein